MATVDPRLQPLITALNEAGYDWIAAEIIQAIRDGVPKLANEDDLARVRDRIDGPTEFPEDIEDDETISSIEGTQQLSFAANLIEARFKHVASMLHFSQQRLNLMARGHDQPDPRPRLAFLVDEEIRPITAAALQKVADDLEELASQLDDWVQSIAQGDPQ